MKVTVVYTMNGCPHCTHIKEELTKNNILFIERDIDDFGDEYEEFTKITNNEYVPALMLLTIGENDETSNVKLLAPDRDYQDIYEGVKMVKEYLLD
jgi:glutaredoxin